MATFAPPARRGDFLFSSVLYADPGNNNQHPRASVAELAALLRPEAPSLYSKGSKPDVASPAKDPPWHYYGAQLIHYGLPVTKDKNTAKVRLLNALNQFKLEVPAWILKLESELKKQWEADNRKLKKDQGSARVAKAVQSNKQLGSKDSAAMSKKESAAATKKESKATTNKESKATTNKESKATTKKEAKATIKNSSDINVTVNLSLMDDLSIGKQRSVVTAKPSKPSAVKRRRSTSPPASEAKKATKIKKESTPQMPAGKRLALTPSHGPIKDEFQSRSAQLVSRVSSPRIKADPYADSNDESGRTLLSGHYEVTCPIASDVFGEYDFDLTLSLDSVRMVWWVTFCWGAWDGLIQMYPGPTADPFGRSCSLKYRLRDLQTGQLSFSNKCTGTMTFYKNETLRACLFDVPGIGAVDFEGTRVPGPNVENDLQDEWEGFVNEAYRR